MKALIPAAGRGTRLYPHTHTKPKAMVRLAGRPILGHILDSLSETRIDEVVIVVGGPMQDQIVEYARSAFGDEFEFSFPEEESPEGLGHAVYQAREVVEGESVVIALGDMLFENGYETFLTAHDQFEDVDGSIGLKSVEEPQHYGIAEIDGEYITSLVEKPDDPPSNEAISGAYIVENTPALFAALEHFVENDIRGAGDEYQLTDALDRMLDQGCTLGRFDVEDWYDCGRPETLLEANRVLLESLETDDGAETVRSVVVPPVDIGDDVTIEESVVGPDVSIDDGSTVTNSIVRDSILGQDATLTTVNITHSIIGTNTNVEGEANELNLGDNSTLEL
ncbi:MAG: sugar nucleotidyltransferase [Halobaculum sp.]